MTKVIVLYASLTGNTEEMAESIAEGARAAGAITVLKEAFDAKAEELLLYDGVVIGAYTWGDGELPDEFIAFYEELNSVDLTGIKTAVFGSGDTSYPIFCGAVDTIESKLKQLGATIVCDSLKFEYNATEEEKEQGRQMGMLVAEAAPVAT